MAEADEKLFIGNCDAWLFQDKKVLSQNNSNVVDKLGITAEK